MALTKELIRAGEQDLASIASVVNGGAYDNGDGTVTTRKGTKVKTLLRLLYDIVSLPPIGWLEAFKDSGLSLNNKGDPGASNNTRMTLAQLKAASTNDKTSLFDGSLWTWTIGDYSNTPPADIDVNVVQGNGIPLNVGAWERQLAEKTYLRRYKADRTGATSSAAALRAALAASLVVMGSPGDTYYIDEPVDIPEGRLLIGNGAKFVFPAGVTGLRFSSDRSAVRDWKIHSQSALYTIVDLGWFNEVSGITFTGDVGHYYFGSGCAWATVTRNIVQGISADVEITTAFVFENAKNWTASRNKFFDIMTGWGIQARGAKDFTIDTNKFVQEQYSDEKTATASQTVFNFTLGSKILVEKLSGKPKGRIQINGKPLSPTQPNGQVNYTISGSGPNYTVTFSSGRPAGQKVKFVGYRGAENIQISVWVPDPNDASKNVLSSEGLICNNTVDGTGDAGMIGLGYKLTFANNKIRRAGYAGLALYGSSYDITVVGNTFQDCAQMDDGLSSPDDYRQASPFAGGLFIAGEDVAVNGNTFINDAGTMNYAIMVQKTDVVPRVDGSAAIVIAGNQYKGNYKSGKIYAPNETFGQRIHSMQVDGPPVLYPLQLDLEAPWMERTPGSAAQGFIEPANTTAITISGSDGVRVVRNTSITKDGGVSMQTVAGQYIDFTYNRVGVFRDCVITVQFWARNAGGSSYAHVVTALSGPQVPIEIDITEQDWILFTVRVTLTDNLDDYLRIRFGGNIGSANIQNVQVTGNRL